MGKDKLKMDSMMPLEQAAATLEELACSLKNGTISVQLGQETMQLCPAGVVQFEMKVSRKKEKQKISLEVSWDAEESPEAVQISSTAPGMKLG